MTRLPFLVAALVLAGCTGSANAPPPSTSQSAAPSSAPASSSTTAASSSATPSTPSPISEAAVLGSWAHHQEKDKEKTQQYVRPEQELPPARFRQTFTLEAGGVARVLCLAPNDAHALQDGTWKLSNDTLTIDAKCFGQTRTMRFRVLEASPVLLRLEALD